LPQRAQEPGKKKKSNPMRDFAVPSDELYLALQLFMQQVCSYIAASILRR
jgi:hypothetical protein